MNKLKTHIIILFFIPLISISQNNDYFITKGNDTIYGRIKWGSHTLVPNSGKEKIKADSNKIIGYYTESNNEFYESVISPFYGGNKEPVFLLRLISGKINLYSRLTNKEYGITTYYTSKNNTNPIALFDNDVFSNKKRHRKVRKLIEDNPSLTKEFDSMKGKLKNIISIIKKYNKQG